MSKKCPKKCRKSKVGLISDGGFTLKNVRNSIFQSKAKKLGIVSLHNFLKMGPIQKYLLRLGHL